MLIQQPCVGHDRMFVRRTNYGFAVGWSFMLARKLTRDKSTPKHLDEKLPSVRKFVEFQIFGNDFCFPKHPMWKNQYPGPG